MNMLRFLNKPEYLLQPSAALRRVFGRPDTADGLKIVPLRWGLPIEVDTRDSIGLLIWRSGIFEISVVEAIFRLTDPADFFLDFGANIGFMSSVALAAGVKRVISFEPHPDLFLQFRRNISLWTESRPQIADCITSRNEAISEKTGVAMLRIPTHRFSRNRGLSTLETGQDDEEYSAVEVPTTTLTQVLGQCSEPVGVLKIDIEGHELTALTASQESLQSGRVRDIIFEDHNGMNSKVSQLLSGLGYSIFGLNKTPLGPILLGSDASNSRFFTSGAANFLATLDPGRARQRMSGHGFRCLQHRPKVSP